MGRSAASVLAGSSKRGWPLRLVQQGEPTSGELYGPSIDALRPVPGRARNGTVGYQNETLKRQPGSGSALPCSDNARNAARSVYTAPNPPSTALGTPRGLAGELAFCRGGARPCSPAAS